MTSFYYEILNSLEILFNSIYYITPHGKGYTIYEGDSIYKYSHFDDIVVSDFL